MCETIVWGSRQTAEKINFFVNWLLLIVIQINQRMLLLNFFQYVLLQMKIVAMLKQ